MPYPTRPRARTWASLALSLFGLAGCSDQPAAIRNRGTPRTAPHLLQANVGTAETGHVWICKNGVPGASYDFVYTSTTPPSTNTTTVVVPGCNMIWDVQSQGETDLSIAEVPKGNSYLVEVDIADGLAGTTLQQYFAPPGGSLTGSSFAVHATSGIQLLAVFDNVTQCPATTISSNFNGTSIAGGNTVWFSAIIKPSGVSSDGGYLLLGRGTVSFVSNGISYAASVPPIVVYFSPTATSASSTYDGTRWITVVPWSYTGNVFLGGAAFSVPDGGLPGGINPVTWTESMATNIPGLAVNWKWAAAVYPSLGDNLSQLGVKPVDANGLSVYANSDHAGTPENFASYVLAGARGGGGSNFTGSYSGTASTKPCTPQ